MDVRAISQSPVYTGSTQERQGRAQDVPAAGMADQDQAAGAGGTPLLTGDEKSFFEGLFPESRNDVRAYQAYSGRGEQQQSVPMGTLVDRKG